MTSIIWTIEFLLWGISGLQNCKVKLLFDSDRV